MGKVVAIANQKGGVGKTATAVNLTACLGAMENKILIIDLDPQGNTTSGFGIVKKQIENSSYHVLIGKVPIEETIFNSAFKNVDVVPAGIDLAGAELELVEMQNRTIRLKAEIARIKEKYKFIIIDCPPSLGMLTLNALSACDSVIIPVQCEYYALEGLAQLIATIRNVKRTYNPYIEIESVLLTMYDSRLNLTHQVVSEVKKHFPGKVFSTVIPRNVRIAESPSFGKPVIYYDTVSRGTKAYKLMAEEFLRKNKQ
ncbi:MAG: AAA family ATPase [Oscillospiraceae bacterium]|nr:AAA family ATPase [Oscillospiraceae bacterium]